MKIEGTPSIIQFDPFTLPSYPGTNVNATPAHTFGETVYASDGRWFRFAAAAGTSTVGKLQLSPAPIANHKNMTTAVAAIGSFQVTVTPGATAGNASIYDEGYLIVNAGTGLGQTYKVEHNPAITSSTAFVVSLFDPIAIALDATSKTTLVQNRYNLVVQGTTQTQLPAGVPFITAAATNFFWLQTKGVASVLSDGATAVGNTVVISGSVAGAVAIGSTTYGTFQATMPVGKALVASVDTEYRPIMLEID